MNETKQTVAKNEEIGENQLTIELASMLRDCFVGDLKYKNNQIVYSMSNGQTFIITVKAMSTLS